MGTRRLLAWFARIVVAVLLLGPVTPAGVALTTAAPTAAQEATPAEETNEPDEGGPRATEETEGGPGEASAPTANVELILDSSGSMAEESAGGETKIAAAKRAMGEVIDQIPEREGFNVGLRVYGHEGTNREEDKEQSCQSTELLVPIDGVDTAALHGEVEAVTPTGWTPLALALEAAATDFEPGGESVTNAVIMVTDGEETCGGDPCAVAGQLNAAAIALTTHVVGFGLTPEQQDAVRCIADEGGGQLFTANDADSLSEAVFSAFQQLEATEQGYLGGNAFPLLEQGEAGEISVIAIGPYNEGLGLPIVVRNATGQDVERIEVSAVARDAGGTLLGEGATLNMYPHVVIDGGVAFGRIYFGVGEMPDDTRYEDVEIDFEPRSGDEPLFLDMTVEKADQQGEQIVGIVRNDWDQDVMNMRPAIACFDETGALLEVAEDPFAATEQSLESGGDSTITFQPGGTAPGLAGPCPAFLFAVQAQAGLP